MVTQVAYNSAKIVRFGMCVINEVIDAKTKQ